jgi:hypothetical protein
MTVSSLQLKPFAVMPLRNQTNNIVCVLSFRTVDLTMPYGVNARSYARVSEAKDQERFWIGSKRVTPLWFLCIKTLRNQRLTWSIMRSAWISKPYQDMDTSYQFYQF